MILNNWTRPSWTDGQTEAYMNALVPYDPELAVNAIAMAHKQVGFRPSFSEFMQFYKLAKVEAGPQGEPMPPRVYTRGMPLWVKRWICARFLWRQFDREQQDMRVFAEQRQWSDPDAPLMPPDEWTAEAERLKDSDAIKAFRLTFRT